MSENLSEAQQVLESNQQAQLVSVIGALMHIHKPEQFLLWTKTELQAVFPHDIAMCGVGCIEDPVAKIINHISVNLPRTYDEEIKRTGRSVLNPVMEKWLKEKKPQLFDSAQSIRASNPKWVESFNRYGLRNIAAHGMSCINEPIFSYFSFSRVPQQLGPRHAFLLEILAPSIHLALTRVLLHKDSPQGRDLLKKPIEPMPVALTSREKQVLQWLKEGKTNWEIGQILTISDETVKSHVQKLLAKLKVGNRMGAVLRAMELGVIAP